MTAVWRVHPVSPLFAGTQPRQRPRPAGLILGCASLTVEQIRRGVGALADVMAGLRLVPLAK